MEIQLRKQFDEKGKEKDATQTELDDLLMVFGDLEEKVEKYKVRYEAPLAYISHPRMSVESESMY